MLMRIIETQSSKEYISLFPPNVRGIEFEGEADALHFAMQLNAYARQYDEPMFASIDVTKQAGTALALQQRILQELTFLAVSHDGEIGSFGIPIERAIASTMLRDAVEVSEAEIERAAKIPEPVIPLPLLPVYLLEDIPSKDRLDNLYIKRPKEHIALNITDETGTKRKTGYILPQQAKKNRSKTRRSEFSPFNLLEN
ncbi:MAG TPA: hypothetical protein VMR76_01640 [Candidatus Saccharimonadia bacterium]|nr:hypothetical protein [Candidatus Saccharimonadia bacterium]